MALCIIMVQCPENVRLYVENAFSKIKEVKYIITTSTLLQGVNIPAEKIFLLNTQIGKGYLNAAQFKNLSGRICRFSEVFDTKKGSLKLLEPEIYVIKSKFNRKANIEKFLKDRVKDNKVIEDKIDNPLIKQHITELKLNEVEKKIVKDAEEYQENIERGSSALIEPTILSSEIAKACFRNNIHDFDIFENENQLENNLKGVEVVSNPKDLIYLIAKMFLHKTKLKEKNDPNLKRFKRLENSGTKNFYSMFLNWRARGTPYNIMINNFIRYWERIKEREEQFIYVGHKWGEVPHPSEPNKNLTTNNIFIDLSKKGPKQRINIAILIIKDEQDFIDFKLMPYVEILNDLELIDSNFYERIKYGTDDKEMIKMLKEGFSFELAKLIKKGNYSEYVNISEKIEVKTGIIKKMRENNENEILIFEIEYYTH